MGRSTFHYLDNKTNSKLKKLHKVVELELNWLESRQLDGY